MDIPTIDNAQAAGSKVPTPVLGADKAAWILVVGSVLWLAFVRRAFSQVLA
jgi:hypothetical protein